MSFSGELVSSLSAGEGVMLLSCKPSHPGRTRTASVLRIFGIGLLGSCLTLATAASAGAQRPEETFFELKVRPVLADKCFKCHGGKKISHGLRVDSRLALLNGGESGPAIVSGAPEKSLL